MKRCWKCGVQKEDGEFYKSTHRKDGLQGVCKECDKRLKKENYHSNKEVTREARNERSREFRRERRLLLDSLKRPCCKCGESRVYCLDFHHIDPKTNVFNLANAIQYSTGDVLVEREKVSCLCRNCHMEYHHFYGNAPSDPVGSLTEYLGRNPYEI
jgi:hypothetical protein